MNKSRRKQLAVIHAIAVRLQEQLESIRDDEQEYGDNMPESLQYNSQRWDDHEEALQYIEEAVNYVEYAANELEQVAEGNVRHADMMEVLQ